MRLLVATAVLLLWTASTFAQPFTLRVRVLDAHERQPLPGAMLRLDGTPQGAVTDADGRALLTGLSGPSVTLVVSYVGYRTVRQPVSLPRADTSALVIALEEDEDALDEVVVSATRAGRTIADTPTRVEVIGEEEIGEKVNMDPSGIAMVLNESPGITVQQTSAVSGTAGFRIQGLEGRYTQLLRNGYPLYGGLSGGLSLLQIPPLDLAAVEIIKGPASTLYGGDALAGIVNLVTKRPTAEGERTLLVNGTTAGGFDAAGYYAKRGARTGLTVLASGNLQRAYDAEDDGFTNLPAARRLTVTPTLYGYGAGQWEVGLNASAEVRTGGDVAAVRGDTAGYTERTSSARLSGHAGYDRPLGTSDLRLRTSASRFARALTVPSSRFDGQQWATYSEASLRAARRAHNLVGGLDLRTDAFAEAAAPGAAPRSFRQGALGAFVQDTWDVAPALVLEGGLRLDRHRRRASSARADGWFVLPRASLLLRPARDATVRVGGGLGYKAPTLFLEAAEARAFIGVPAPGADVQAERSTGGGVDVNVRRTAFGDRLAVTFNQAVFYNRLRHALELVAAPEGALRLQNAPRDTETFGSETTARLAFESVSLFLGYVFTDAHRVQGATHTPVPLTARHRTYTVLVWEAHGRFRVGAEAYYTGPQRLPDGGTAPGFLVAGLMGERRFGAARLFVNLENLLDARQSRTSPLVTGPRTTPVFPDIWGPTDGFIANAGVRVAF